MDCRRPETGEYNMKLKKLLFLIIPTLLAGIIISTLLVGCSHADVAIVVSENATETEQLAAKN